MLLQDLLLVGFPFDLIHAFEPAAAEIERRQDPGSLKPSDQCNRPFLVQVPALGVISYLLGQALPQGSQLLGRMGQVTIDTAPAANRPRP